MQYPEFKYQSELCQIEDCPPAAFSRKTRTGYRFVFDDHDQKKCFKPVFISTPKRMASMKDSESKCSGFGLSFFASKTQAETRFRDLEKNFPKIYTALGQYIAAVQITQDHGIQSEPDQKTGHFSLHEFKDVAWSWEVLNRLI